MRCCSLIIVDVIFKQQAFSLHLNGKVMEEICIGEKDWLLLFHQAALCMVRRRLSWSVHQSDQR